MLTLYTCGDGYVNISCALMYCNVRYDLVIARTELVVNFKLYVSVVLSVNCEFELVGKWNSCVM